MVTASHPAGNLAPAGAGFGAWQVLPKNTRVTPSATPPIASSPTDLAFRILCPPATGGGVEAGRGIGLSRVGGEVRGRSRREHEEPLVGSYGVWARLGNDGRDTRTPLHYIELASDRFGRFWRD